MTELQSIRACLAVPEPTANAPCVHVFGFSSLLLNADSFCGGPSIKSTRSLASAYRITADFAVSMHLVRSLITVPSGLPEANVHLPATVHVRSYRDAHRCSLLGDGADF